MRCGRGIPDESGWPPPQPVAPAGRHRVGADRRAGARPGRALETAGEVHQSQPMAEACPGAARSCSRTSTWADCPARDVRRGRHG
jgi:hypothetical protein